MLKIQIWKKSLDGPDAYKNYATFKGAAKYVRHYLGDAAVNIDERYAVGYFGDVTLSSNYVLGDIVRRADLEAAGHRTYNVSAGCRDENGNAIGDEWVTCDGGMTAGNGDCVACGKVFEAEVQRRAALDAKYGEGFADYEESEKEFEYAVQARAVREGW